MAAIDTPLIDSLGVTATTHTPISPNTSEKDTLIAHLDALLEKYLHTLDTYQKQREQLSKQLSSGFLSLAQANFQNRSSTAHYGRDCYDERMQAIRKVSITNNTNHEPSFTISNSHETKVPQMNEHAEQEQEKQAGEDLDGSDTTSSKMDGQNEEHSESTARNTDPIRWFGILVPQSLRSAQASFISSVEGPIPSLVNISRDLRSQEIEIGRLRKAIKKV